MPIEEARHKNKKKGGKFEEGSSNQKKIRHSLKRPNNLSAFRNTNKEGYFASTAPEDFLKKKYSNTFSERTNRVDFPASVNSLFSENFNTKLLSDYSAMKREKRKLKGRRYRKKKRKLKQNILKFLNLRGSALQS